MEIFKIDEYNIPLVSELMAKIKPEWWDFEGASSQLSDGIGWYFGIDKEHPKGWILCKSLRFYKTIEIECLGYNDEGCYKIGKELQILVEKIEEWAKEEGYVNARFTIGSTGLSCHNRQLKEPWIELRDLCAFNREEYTWFLSMGYLPSGILPNIYGNGYHGVLLIKTL